MNFLRKNVGPGGSTQRQKNEGVRKVIIPPKDTPKAGIFLQMLKMKSLENDYIIN